MASARTEAAIAATERTLEAAEAKGDTLGADAARSRLAHLARVAEAEGGYTPSSSRPARKATKRGKPKPRLTAPKDEPEPEPTPTEEVADNADHTG